MLQGGQRKYSQTATKGKAKVMFTSSSAIDALNITANQSENDQLRTSFIDRPLHKFPKPD